MRSADAQWYPLHMGLRLLIAADCDGLTRTAPLILRYSDQYFCSDLGLLPVSIALR